MPYNAKNGQATAAFLAIKKNKGLSAAKAFGRKHRKELSAAAKASWQPARLGLREPSQAWCSARGQSLHQSPDSTGLYERDAGLMPRAQASAITTLRAEMQNLKALRQTFLSQGDRELATAAQRALREFQTSSVAGAVNQSTAAFDVNNP